MKRSTKITAALLYDLVQCPHRPAMDLFGDPAKRDEINPFVELLWEKGTSWEHEVMDNLKIPFLDLSRYSLDEKEFQTVEAMKRGEPLIYSARISADDLLGDPDLLRREGEGYVAGDIKSGSGQDGEEDAGRPKKHYGVQLALYTDVLERKGLAASRHPFIWDVHGEEVTYDLEERRGTQNPTTLWQIYQTALGQARRIAAQAEKTDPAQCSACKMCHWHCACLKELERSDDLTLLPELGRAKRNAMAGAISTVSELANINVDQFIVGKRTAFQGISPATLSKFQERAQLVTTKGAKPYLKTPIDLPTAELELFFDIEVDPMRDICYLHGFVERRGENNKSERYVAFFADEVDSSEEERAFSEALQYIRNQEPCVMYYYSKYERTIWRKLQSKYPSVCTADDIEELFHPTQAVDLYFDVVRKATEWPTHDYSIKTLARYLGFKWRDTHPSGAASIEWFDRWARSQDPEIKQRILDYNEDDCVATRVLLDGIRALH